MVIVHSLLSAQLQQLQQAQQAAQAAAAAGQGGANNQDANGPLGQGGANGTPRAPALPGMTLGPGSLGQLFDWQPNNQAAPGTQAAADFLAGAGSWDLPGAQHQQQPGQGGAPPGFFEGLGMGGGGQPEAPPARPPSAGPGGAGGNRILGRARAADAPRA